MSPQEIEALRALIRDVAGVTNDGDACGADALRSYLATHQEVLAAGISAMVPPVPSER